MSYRSKCSSQTKPDSNRSRLSNDEALKSVCLLAFATFPVDKEGLMMFIVFVPFPQSKIPSEARIQSKGRNPAAIRQFNCAYGGTGPFTSDLPHVPHGQGQSDHARKHESHKPIRAQRNGTAVLGQQRARDNGQVGDAQPTQPSV